jgi:hypothetical protein
LTSSYNKLFLPAKHPYVDFIYQIKALIDQTPTCYDGYLNLPGKNGYTYANGTYLLSQMIQDHDLIIDKLKKW